MTQYQGHLARHVVTPPWTAGLRRTGVARRPRAVATPTRLSPRFVAAVVLEAAVLLATVQFALGVGYLGNAAAVPTPAPAPSYAPAPPQRILTSGPDAPVAIAALPAPLAAPAPAPVR